MKKITTGEKIGWVVGGVLAAVMTAGAYFKFLPLGLTEVLGFVTGALCVWLVVKENIWNWPIGIANSVFFLILFLEARLYADMGLQVIYIILGFLGWYWWLKGGKNRTALKVEKATLKTWFYLVPITAIGTYVMMKYLQTIGDAAPFLDALTTCMSLAAQYLLTKKYIENWYIWISADVIYIGLYIWKGLWLTGILYGLFLTMCIIGLREWEKAKNRTQCKMIKLLHC